MKCALPTDRDDPKTGHGPVLIFPHGENVKRESFVPVKWDRIAWLWLPDKNNAFPSLIFMESFFFTFALTCIFFYPFWLSEKNHGRTFLSHLTWERDCFLIYNPPRNKSRVSVWHINIYLFRNEYLSSPHSTHEPFLPLIHGMWDMGEGKGEWCDNFVVPYREWIKSLDVRVTRKKATFP